MTPRRATLALALLLAVAAAEWVAAAFAYRDALRPEHWAALRARAAAPPAPRPHPPPHPALRAWASVAPPDLHALPRFHVLAWGDPWTPDLRDDWGPRPRPRALAREPFGPLTLHTFEHPEAERLLDAWVDAAPRLQVRDPRGPCRPRPGGAWACARGEVRLTVAEIAYRPRRALCLDLDDAPITLTLDADLGDHLRGHLGFADFNARLRSDAPLLLTLRVDGRPLPSLVLTDAQGWAAFTAPTEPGRRRVEVELRPAVPGTWGDAGYRPTPRLRPCLELRALAAP